MILEERTKEAVNAIEAIVKAICRKTPEPYLEFNGDVLEIQVDREDQGRLIGKQGIGYWALQTVAHHAAELELAILEPEGGKFDRGKPVFKPRMQWDGSLMIEAARLIGLACGDSDEVRLERSGHASGSITLTLSNQLRGILTADPGDIGEAFEVLMHAAGKAEGAIINAVVEWR